MIKTKKDTIKSLATHEKDVGSTEIQIGLLTDKELLEQSLMSEQAMLENNKVTNSEGASRSISKNISR